MEPYSAASTPSQGMGRIAEEVRLTSGALRSEHPQASFAALGPDADRITADHPLDCLLGERSPLGRLHECAAWILLLGVGFEVCSAFHLAEYRTPAPVRRRYDCRVLTEHGPCWRDFTDVDLDDTDFAELGRWLRDRADDGRVAEGRIGDAVGLLLPLRWAVDTAVGWLAARRPAARGLRREAGRA